MQFKQKVHDFILATLCFYTENHHCQKRCTILARSRTKIIIIVTYYVQDDCMTVTSPTPISILGKNTHVCVFYTVDWYIRTFSLYTPRPSAISGAIQCRVPTYTVLVVTCLQLCSLKKETPLKKPISIRHLVQI